MVVERRHTPANGREAWMQGGRSFVARAVLGLLAFTGSATALDVVHNVGFTKTCAISTNIGDSYQCSYLVQNSIDEAHDTLTVNGLVDVVHSAGGDQTSGNVFGLIADRQLHDADRGVHAVECELHGAVRHGNASEPVDERDELHVAGRLDAELPFRSRTTPCRRRTSGFPDIS